MYTCISIIHDTDLDVETLAGMYMMSVCPSTICWFQQSFFFSKIFFQFWSHQLKGRFDSQIASDDDPNPNDGFKCCCTDDYSQTCPQHFRSPFVFLKKGAFFKVGDWNNSGITMSNLRMFDEWIFNLRISSNFFPHRLQPPPRQPQAPWHPQPLWHLRRCRLRRCRCEMLEFHMGISWWFSWLL